MFDICFGLLTAFAFAVGLVEEVLQGHTKDLYHEHLDNVSGQWKGPAGTHYIFFIPAHFRSQVIDFIIGAGALAIVTSIACLAYLQHRMQFAYIYGDDNARLKKWRLTSCLISTVSACVTLAVLVYAFVEEYTSSLWHYSNFESSHGHFTPESWICQMQHQYTYNRDPWWSSACNEMVSTHENAVCLFL